MKSFILISVLAALAVCNNANSIAGNDANAIPEEDVIISEESGEVFQKDYGPGLNGRFFGKWNDNDLILFYEYV